MLKLISRLFNLHLFNFLSLCFLLISLQSCKSAQAVVAETDNKTFVSEAFTEKIPATDISFDMVLIPEGTFMMGSPENQVNRKADEGPMKTVELDAFYMGKYELGWEVFELFFKQNKNLFENLEADKLKGIDAITRPSPPRTMRAQLFGNIRMVGGTFKNHVFQKVGHAFFSITFMSGPYQIGNIDRYGL